MPGSWLALDLEGPTVPRLSLRTPLLTAGLVATLTLVSGCGDASTASGSSTLRVSGSTTVNPVAADAAEALRKDGLTITVDTQGGSAGGITQLAAGQIDVAMSSKPLADSDRAAAPDVDFQPTLIGQDAVGIAVRKEVVAGGLRSLTKAQLRALFEGSITNWKQVGGPDLATFVYDKEPGRGTREVLDKYLYAKGEKVPPAPADNPRYAIVGGNEETRTKLLSTPGSVAPLSVSFVAGYDALALLAVEGVSATPATIADSSYALSRPLFLITDGAPTGAAKTFIDYVLGPKGDAILAKHGFLTVAQLKG